MRGSQMKKIISILFIILFICGLYMIIESGSGMFGDYTSSIVSGGILSVFSGIWLTITLYSLFRKSNDKKID